MKFKLMAGAATAAFISASAAHAADGWYAAFDLGIDNPGPFKTRNLNTAGTGGIGVTEMGKAYTAAGGLIQQIVTGDSNSAGGIINCNNQVGFIGTGSVGSGTATGSRA